MDTTMLLPPLAKEQEDAILIEIEYSREQLNEDEKQLREWLVSQEHLPPSRLKESDSFLEHFLVGCKGSLEKAKKKLDCYYTVRTYSEIHENRDPMEENYLNVKKMCEWAVVPDATTADGTRLVLMTLCDKEPDKFVLTSFFRYYFNSFEIFMRMVGFGSKLYILFDCKGLSASILMQVKPMLVKDAVTLYQETLPFRYVKLILFNAPSFFVLVVNNLVKPLLTKKLRERYFIYSTGLEGLLKDFSPSMLPRDYGGLSTNPSLREYSDRWSKYEKANRQWFLNELSEKNDESKRISPDYLTQNPLFGVHGSLKKLVID